MRPREKLLSLFKTKVCSERPSQIKNVLVFSFKPSTKLNKRPHQEKDENRHENNAHIRDDPWLIFPQGKSGDDEGYKAGNCIKERPAYLLRILTLSHGRNLLRLQTTNTKVFALSHTLYLSPYLVNIRRLLAYLPAHDNSFAGSTPVGLLTCSLYARWPTCYTYSMIPTIIASIVGFISFISLDYIWIGVITKSFYLKELATHLALKDGVLATMLPYKWFR